MLSNKIFAKAIISLLIAAPLCYAAAEPQAATFQGRIEYLQNQNAQLRNKLRAPENRLQRLQGMLEGPMLQQRRNRAKIEIAKIEIARIQAKIDNNVRIIENLRKYSSHRSIARNQIEIAKLEEALDQTKKMLGKVLSSEQYPGIIRKINELRRTIDRLEDDIQLRNEQITELEAEKAY